MNVGMPGDRELELLALIEGEALPPGRAEALLGDPATAAFVEACRRDRIGLATLEGGLGDRRAAPTGLVQGAIEEAERLALERLRSAEPEEALPPPPAYATIRRRASLDRSVRWGGRLALAAGVVIAGLAAHRAYVGIQSMVWRDRGSSIGDMGPDVESLAVDPREPVSPGEPGLTVADAQPGPAGGAESDAGLSALDPLKPSFTQRVEVARAVELAAQGEVALVVRGEDAARTILMARSSARMSVRVLDDTPGWADDVAVAIRRDGRGWLASAGDAGPGVRAAGASSAIRVAVIELPLDRVAFTTLEDGLRAADGRSASGAMWMRLDPALLEHAHNAAARESLSPQSVLWWTGDPRRWTPRTVVPVLIFEDGATP